MITLKGWARPQLTLKNQKTVKVFGIWEDIGGKTAISNTLFVKNSKGKKIYFKISSKHVKKYY